MQIRTTRRPALQARRFSLGDWMSAPEWISISQAVQLTGYNAEYIRRVIRQKKVKAEKLPGGREWLIDRESMRNYKYKMDKLGTDKHNRYRDD